MTAGDTVKLRHLVSRYNYMVSCNDTPNVINVEITLEGGGIEASWLFEAKDLIDIFNAHLATHLGSNEPAEPPKPLPDHQRWEYRWLSANDIELDIDEIGEDGWEAVLIDNQQLILFKREAR